MNEKLKIAKSEGRGAFSENKNALAAEDSFLSRLRGMGLSSGWGKSLASAWRDGWIEAAREAGATEEARRKMAEALVDGRNGLVDFIAAALALGAPLSEKAKAEMLQSLPHLRGAMGSRRWSDEVSRVSEALFQNKV